MLPTVPVYLLQSGLCGLLFAACARPQWRKDRVPWGRELWAIVCFETIIAWPVALYFFLVFPDWSWMFLVDPKRLPLGASALVLLGGMVTLVGGWLGGWALLRAQRDRLAIGIGAGGALMLLLFVILTRGRLFSGGTYAEYHAGAAPPAGDGKLGWSLGATAIGVAAAAAFVCLTIREEGRRFRND
jgi:hypothetical protein